MTARVPEEGHAPGDRAREGGRGETAAVSQEAETSRECPVLSSATLT